MPTTIRENEPTEPVTVDAPPFPGESPPDEWRTDAKGRRYTTRGDGRRGPLYQRDDETVDQARERDALGPQPRPKKPKAPKRLVPDPPREADLKELERTLTEALKQPGLVAAAFGDEWASEHFVVMAPAVSRNLIVASKHNPWLRRKLEDAATGQDAAMAVISLVPLAGAAVMYLLPPLIYWFDLPVSERGRKMLGEIPHRNGARPVPTAGPPTPTNPVPDANGTPPTPFPPFAPAGTASPPPFPPPA